MDPNVTERLSGLQRTYGPVILWDARNGRKLATFGGTRDDGVSLTFSRDSRLILSVIKADAGRDKLARTNGISVWDVVTKKELLRVREDQNKEFNEVVLAPDDKTVMALAGSEVGSQLEGSTDKYLTNRVRLWDIQRGKELITLKAESAKFSPDGRFLLFTYPRTYPREQPIWDIREGKVRPDLHISGPANFSPDGAFLACGQELCGAAVWEVASGKKLVTLPGQKSSNWLLVARGPRMLLSFSPDGNLLATQCTYGPITLWNVHNGSHVATLALSSSDIFTLQFSADSKSILSIGDSCTGPTRCPNILTAWDVGSQKELLRVFLGDEVGTARAAFSPDGETVIVYAGERLRHVPANREPEDSFNVNAIRLWDVDRAEELATIKASTQTSASFSPNGKSLLVADPDLGSKVLDIKAKKISAIGPVKSFEQARDLSAENIAKSVGNNKWNWTVFIKGDKQSLDNIKCVEYKLHPTFPDPVKLVCELGDPKRPFGLSATGWGTFPINIRVFMMDGSHRDLLHQLKF